MVIGLGARLVHTRNCALTSKHSLSVIVGKVHEHHVGKALLSVAYVLKNTHNQEIGFTKGSKFGMESGWPFTGFQLAYYMPCLEPLQAVNTVSSSRVMVIVPHTIVGRSKSNLPNLLWSSYSDFMKTETGCVTFDHILMSIVNHSHYSAVHLYVICLKL